VSAHGLEIQSPGMEEQTGQSTLHSRARLNLKLCADWTVYATFKRWE